MPQILKDSKLSMVTELTQNHKDYVSLVQISDLHIFDDPSHSYGAINPANTLDAVMRLIQREFNDTDLLAVTGDLLQQPSYNSYSHLFRHLATLNLPFVAIAGNHDVTMELDSHLPFEQRRHISVLQDKRLVNRHVTRLPHWDILWLDSSVQGHIAGCFSAPTLDWLVQTLENSERPCIIFTHHPMAKLHSHWIDNHWLKNAQVFWDTIAPYTKQIKGIFVGHVHQEAQLLINGVSVFTCPSTSIQFKPFCEDYAVDDIPAGLRWLTLYNNGKLATGIKRIDNV
jgi:Icc protein